MLSFKIEEMAACPENFTTEQEQLSMDKFIDQPKLLYIHTHTERAKATYYGAEYPAGFIAATVNAHISTRIAAF